MKISLGGVSKPARIAIAVVPAVIYILVFGYLVILPKTKQVKDLRGQIAAQDNDIMKTQSLAAKLDKLKEENANLRARLDELAQQLPEEKEISQLLRQVSQKGITAGLDILTWKPSERTIHPSNIVYTVPVEVTLKGSYHKLGEFFSALTHLSRIVNIMDIKMGSPKLEGSEAVLAISFTAVTFTAAESGGLAQ
jgi:type IV pilus assembly protein PilO